MMLVRMAHRREHRNEISSRCLAPPVDRESQSHTRVEVLRFIKLVAHCVYRSKCDRQVPCISCSKRRDAASCKYSNGGRNGPNRRDGGSRASEAHLRLQKLEEMVTCLMKTAEEGSESCGNEKSTLHNAKFDQHLEDVSAHSLPQTLETSSAGQL
jgi:hypothetical protein